MKKALQHGGKCGGDFESQYTDSGTPYLVCSKCQYRLEDWIKWEQEYKDHWKNEEKWLSKKDHLVCLLGYFANLYHVNYGTTLVLSLNDRGLFMGPEAHQIRKLLKNCAGDAQVAKQYLDWVFLTKVQKRKKRITSLGFLNTQAILNEFFLARKKSALRTRSTPLPAGMINWIRAKAPGVLEQTALNDFGDLHTLLSHYRRGHLNSHADTVAFVEKLIQSGVVEQDLKINNWSE
jgi:hypothetical protein